MSFEPGDKVSTPYGICYVKHIFQERDMRGPCVLCIPLTWTLAYSTQPRFYMTPSDVRLVDSYSVDDEITCNYGGAGYITEVRADHYVVKLHNWALADGQSPTLYLSKSERIKINFNKIENDLKEGERLQKEIKRINKIREAIIEIHAVRDQAAAAFKEKRFSDAVTLYAAALNHMNNVGYEMPDKLRAEILEMSIPCNNNLALCYMKTENFENAEVYANNGILLIDAMEGQIKKGFSNTWIEMQKRGTTFEKMTKDWKKKSYFFKGKALLKKNKFDDAIKCFDNAIALVQGEEKYEKTVKELEDFISQAKKGIEKQKKKEKKLWSKALAKSSKAAESEEISEKLAEMTQTVNVAPISTNGSSNGAPQMSVNGKAKAKEPVVATSASTSIKPVLKSDGSLDVKNILGEVGVSGHEDTFDADLDKAQDNTLLYTGLALVGGLALAATYWFSKSTSRK